MGSITYALHQNCHSAMYLAQTPEPYTHFTPVPQIQKPNRMCDMKLMADAIRAGKGSLRDLEEYMAFVNEYLYKVRVTSRVTRVTRVTHGRRSRQG